MSRRSYRVATATIIRMERTCRIHGTDVVFLASAHGEAELLAASLVADGWREVASEAVAADVFGVVEDGDEVM